MLRQAHHPGGLAEDHVRPVGQRPLVKLLRRDLAGLGVEALQVLQPGAQDGGRDPERAVEGAQHAVFAPQAEVVEADGRGAAHQADLALREEDALRRGRGRPRRLEGRVRAPGQKSLRAVRAQVFARRVEVAQLRRVPDAAHVYPAAPELLAVKGRATGGEAQRPAEERALHRLDRPLRRDVQEAHGPPRLHAQDGVLDLLDDVRQHPSKR
jgi:hypothetical protein